MTSLSGCVLPVGPRFEDPPIIENFTPVITETQPLQGSVVTAVSTSQTFTIICTDANVGDDLYVRWIGEYPSYSASSHLLQSDIKISHSVNGQQLEAPNSISVTCFNPLARTIQHAITVFVSDQPFWDPSDPKAPTDLEKLLTENVVNSQMAQANWQLILPCQ